MLDPLDQRIQQMGLPFVRYADDFLILCKTQAQALQALSEISAFITGTLKLIVNQDKTRVAKLEDCSFLGFQIPQGLLAHEFQ
jgi:RNA-directed DNA polymerase